MRVLFFLIIYLPYSALGQSFHDSLTWVQYPFPASDPGRAIISLDSTGWSISYGQHLYWWDGNAWQASLHRPTEQVKTIYMLSATNVWAGVTIQSEYRHYTKQFDGHYWHYLPSPSTVPIRDIFFLTPNDGWAVCEWGEIIHYDGVTWQRVASPTNYHLNCVRMAAPNCGWISGESRGKGIILTFQQNQWRILHHEFSTELKRIQVQDLSKCWIETNDGRVIVQVNGDSISHLTIPDSIIASSPDFYNFINIAGTLGIMRSDGKCFVFRRLQWYPIPYDSLAATDRWRIGNRQLFRLVRKSIKAKFGLKQPGGFSLLPVDDMEVEYGVAIGDLNNDGLPDIYVVNHEGTNRLISSEVLPEKSYLPGSASLAEKAGIGAGEVDLEGKTNARFYDSGVSMADFDNDGDLDIYLCSFYHANILYQNNGTGRFHNITDQAGVGGQEMAFSHQGIWGDVNNDGWLDLFVANQLASDVLYLNDGKGHFKDVTSKSGLTSNWGSLCPAFSDIDNDGDPDLFIAHDKGKIRLMRNDAIISNTAIPRFTDMTFEAGLDTTIITAYRCGIFGDIDNDGDMDLFITRALFPNQLYLNNGSGHFTDISSQAGFRKSSNSNGAVFFDADNDGYLDLYIGNQGQDAFYHNVGNGSFVEMTDVFGLNVEGNTTGIAAADLPFLDSFGVLASDGYLDLYIASKDKPSFVAVNFHRGHSFFQFKLIGSISNRDAIGARVFLYEGDHPDKKEHLCGVREVQAGAGFSSMSSTIAHFGAQSGKAYDVRIVFPSGTEVVRRNLKPGQFLTIYEQEGTKRFFADLRRAFIRNLYYPGNYFEVAAGVFLLLIIAVFFHYCQFKQWGNRLSLIGLISWPILSYLGIKIFTFGHSYWLYHGLALGIGIAALGASVWYNYVSSQQINREDRLMDLFSACRVFEHNQWQASYFNQMRLVFNNLAPDQKVPQNLINLLEELVTTFYQFTYPEIKRIQQLALQLFPQSDQAAILKNSYLSLSGSLDEIKILSRLNKIISAHLISSLRESIDQLREALNQINARVSKHFSSDLCLVLAKLIQFYRQKQIDIELKTHIGNNPFLIRMPIRDLTFILDNLFSNSIRALIGSPTKSIRMQLTETESEAVLQFIDTGCGIPVELQNRLFKIGITTKNSARNGYGLGRSNMILEKYGGSITLIQSAVGAGAEFQLTFKKIK